jgi:hypothetical protein
MNTRETIKAYKQRREKKKERKKELPAGKESEP